ncbi:MAG: 3-oxoacyl-[acyl-carrier-protein] synthase III C-terminal domain-containing protein [Bacteroidota bacterium]
MSAFVAEEIPASVVAFMANFHSSLSEYDLLAFNQAEVSILKIIAEKLKIPYEKISLNLSKYGDTCGNSIPLLLTDLYGGHGQKELRVLACGFGEGLSWGVADFVIDAKDILEVIETDEVFGDGSVSHVFQQ